MSNTENLGLKIPTLAEKNIHTTYVNNNNIIDEAYGQYINDYEQSLENVAPIEGSTVSKNYTVGQYLVKDGGLYKVTSNIASGESIVVGTNVAATSLNDAVVELNTAVATLQDSVTLKDITPSYTVDSDITVKQFKAYRYGKVVFIVFYFALSSAKVNNSDLLIATTAFPRPVKYSAQAVVSEVAAPNPVGVIALYFDRKRFISTAGPLGAGNYHIAQFCYLTDE